MPPPAPLPISLESISIPWSTSPNDTCRSNNPPIMYSKRVNSSHDRCNTNLCWGDKYSWWHNNWWSSYCFMQRNTPMYPPPYFSSMRESVIPMILYECLIWILYLKCKFNSLFKQDWIFDPNTWWYTPICIHDRLGDPHDPISRDTCWKSTIIYLVGNFFQRHLIWSHLFISKFYNSNLKFLHLPSSIVKLFNREAHQKLFSFELEFIESVPIWFYSC